jgi:hypothetical protein
MQLLTLIKSAMSNNSKFMLDVVNRVRVDDPADSNFRFP